jgi:hypothetical protein
LSSSLTIVASLEKSLVGANEKYFYMEELCDYIFVLCDFLQKTYCPLQHPPRFSN